MADDNVDLVRQIYCGLERGEFGLVDRYFDPAAEVYQTGLLPWAGHYYRGHEGVTNFLMTIIATHNPAAGVGRLIGAGDYVVQTGCAHGRSGRTGRNLDAAEVKLWKMRNGKVVSLQSFVDLPPTPIVPTGHVRTERN